LVFQRHQVNYHLYADDKQAYVNVPVNDVLWARTALQHCISDISSWCSSRCLQLNATKTELIWYALGTIAVNVTWMKRGFNAGQTHHSKYPSIFNRLRAIARYWSEIATFPYPLAFNSPVGGDPLGRSSRFLVGELPDGQATMWCKNIPKS